MDMASKKKGAETSKVADTSKPLLRAAIAEHLANLMRGELSVATLNQIELFARDAKQLLLRVEDPVAILRSRTHPASPTMTMPDGSTVPIPDDITGGPVFSPMSIGSLGSPLASAPASETFGANALRNLVTAFSKSNQKQPNYSDLVRAIADAKEAQLDTDIIESLKAKLRELVGTESGSEESPKKSGKTRAAA